MLKLLETMPSPPEEQPATGGKVDLDLVEKDAESVARFPHRETLLQLQKRVQANARAG